MLKTKKYKQIVMNFIDTIVFRIRGKKCSVILNR